MFFRSFALIGVVVGLGVVFGAPAIADDETYQVAVVNKGQLRSEEVKPRGLFSAIFGGKQELLPETKELDDALDKRNAKKRFKVKSDFEPQTVKYESRHRRGTIVIDPKERYLYLIESSRTARRYAIAVGRAGLGFSGTTTVGDKQEWPRWTPTKEMQRREPGKYARYKDGMDGGLNNPLGARAIYLYQGRQDTHIRIHGTNQPQTIGRAASNGCFRMINDHVIDLYDRVRKGATVIVL